jgi:hypothetical protein
MTPNDAYEILVIILSITLAIFLVLAIVAVSYTIKLLKKANTIADKAEAVAADVESFSSTLKNAAGPAAAMRVMLGAIQGFRK